MKWINLQIGIILMLLQSGCGLIATLGTPTEEEKKVPAEYNLSKSAKADNLKILVLVEQPASLKSDDNLRFYLTEAVNNQLAEKLKIKQEQVFSYEKICEFRTSSDKTLWLRTEQAGKVMGAGLVLLVQIEDYELNKMVDMDYYTGFLNAQAVLIDTETGSRLWPTAAESKAVKVGFDVCTLQRQKAVERLTDSCAHCIVRYLYDCPKRQFKIADDRSGQVWKEWE